MKSSTTFNESQLLEELHYQKDFDRYYEEVLEEEEEKEFNCKKDFNKYTAEELELQEELEAEREIQEINKRNIEKSNSSNIDDYFKDRLYSLMEMHVKNKNIKM